MTAFSSPERTTSIRYALVSWPDFGEVGEVEGVTECSVEENMESTLKASGSMSLSGPWPGGLDDMCACTRRRRHRACPTRRYATERSW